MSNNAQVAGASFPLFSILTIVFVVLKLTGVIGWSWWWVLSPIWGQFVLVAVVVLIALLVGFIRDIHK